ncbi:PREDICTED: uncharacterized protein LOC108559354 isoform X2 [Nicrophorus vespilloides]|nr:PREDICTED: uncharacterized protein LOC108559354 isoform X2 [Nicrophorus vespilloides]
MDCLQLRQQQPGPFHYLINEQAKSLVALQELQHEVGALLEFRDLVIETFPNLRTKMAASSTPATMTSNIPVAVRRAEWEPGVKVRRKLNTSKEERVKKTESAIQDSGFSTETSSKETHSAVTTTSTTATAGNEAEDELWNLLDIIHRKGTRLKDEVEALQGALRDQGNSSPTKESDFQRVLFHASVDDVRQLKRERDHLLERVAEMEAEVLAGRVHTSRLQEDLENLLGAKHDLEEQLKAVVSQRGEVNSRIQDLHSQFVTSSSSSTCADVAEAAPTTSKSIPSKIDDALGTDIPKVRLPDSKKIAAILKEYDPIVLQKHLLTSTVQNHVLQLQLDTAARLELGLVDKLDKAREENDELRFQLEDRNIELEGTKARVRMLENLQKPPSGRSPDIIPTMEAALPSLTISRSEITTASMKAMSPFPINLQLDHSSSTESAHDQAESARKSGSETPRRKPSRIPLVKSYAAPKPPGSAGKHSPGGRSRSGESPGRPQSAQSWRNNRSEGNSLSKSSCSLNKSRNASLTAAKDSLTGKSRTNLELKDSLVSSYGRIPCNTSNTAIAATALSTLRKSSTPNVRRNNSVRDSTDKMVRSEWILSYGSDRYPDSLDDADIVVVEAEGGSAECSSVEGAVAGGGIFYDSIDFDSIESSLYQANGEDLAECDSLERRIDTSDLSTTNNRK